MGKVTVWKMSEEERLAYIERHPIKLNEPIRNTSKKAKEFRWPAKRKAEEAEVR